MSEWPSLNLALSVCRLLVLQIKDLNEGLSAKDAGNLTFSIDIIKLTSTLTNLHFGSDTQRTHFSLLPTFTTNKCNFLSNLWVKKMYLNCFSNLHFCDFCCSWSCFCFSATEKLFVNYLLSNFCPFSYLVACTFLLLCGRFLFILEKHC